MWNKILAEVSLLSPEEAAPRLKELNEHLRDQDKTYPSKKRNEEEE